MFTLFLNPFSPNKNLPEVFPDRDLLHRLQKLHEHEHNCPNCLDIIDRVHARLLNRSQYIIEHDGIAYWSKDRYNIYNPYAQTKPVSWALA